MPSAASYAPLLGLGCQGLLVPGGRALNHGEQEALHRPCLQKQSQKRTHRQPQLRTRRQRRQSPLQAVLSVDRAESFLAGSVRAARNEARPGAFLETATISPGPRPPPNPRRDLGRREHSRHLTRAPPRAPYSRRSDRTRTAPPPPRPPSTLEEAAPRPNHSSSRSRAAYGGEF